MVPRSVDIVLVEDSPLIREQLCALLSAVAGVRIVGTASGEWEAIEMVERLQPQVVLLDISLAPGNGVNVLRALRGGVHPCRVLMLSNMNLQAYRRQCESLGADGFFDKSTEVDELIHEITALCGAGACDPAHFPCVRPSCIATGDSFF